MAQDYRISGQTLTNWADTVRGRKGTTDPIPFAELDSEVLTALNGPTLQDKTVTPSSEQQTITADEGYDGLGTVTVEAAQSGGDLQHTSSAVGEIVEVVEGTATAIQLFTSRFASTANGIIQ